jgi:hypothetical protein
MTKLENRVVHAESSEVHGYKGTTTTKQPWLWPHLGCESPQQVLLCVCMATRCQKHLTTSLLLLLLLLLLS